VGELAGGGRGVGGWGGGEPEEVGGKRRGRPGQAVRYVAGESQHHVDGCPVPDQGAEAEFPAHRLGPPLQRIRRVLLPAFRCAHLPTSAARPVPLPLAGPCPGPRQVRRCVAVEPRRWSVPTKASALHGPPRPEAGAARRGAARAAAPPAGGGPAPPAGRCPGGPPRARAPPPRVGRPAGRCASPPPGRGRGARGAPGRPPPVRPVRVPAASGPPAAVR